MKRPSLRPSQHALPGRCRRTLVAIGGTALAISLLASCASAEDEAETDPTSSVSASAQTPTATPIPTPEATGTAVPLREWNLIGADLAGDAWKSKSREEQVTAVQRFLAGNLPAGLPAVNAGNTGEEIIVRFVAIKNLLIDLGVDSTLAQGEEMAYNVIRVLASEHSKDQSGVDYYNFAVSLAIDDEALGDKGEEGIFRGNPIIGASRYSAELSAATDSQGVTYPFKMVEASVDTLGTKTYTQFGFEWSNELNDWQLFVFLNGDTASDFGRDIVVVDPSRTDAPRR